MFLTKEEYSDLNPTNTLTFEEYTNLYNKAEALISAYTMHFYKKRDFDTDYEFRTNAYKRAIAFQIDYFTATGATTWEELNHAPQNISIGRTSISYGARNSQSKSSDKPLLCMESQIALSGTGLLYRGISQC